MTAKSTRPCKPNGYWLVGSADTSSSTPTDRAQRSLVVRSIPRVLMHDTSTRSRAEMAATPASIFLRRSRRPQVPGSDPRDLRDVSVQDIQVASQTVVVSTRPRPPRKRHLAGGAGLPGAWPDDRAARYERLPAGACRRWPYSDGLLRGRRRGPHVVLTRTTRACGRRRRRPMLPPKPRNPPSPRRSNIRGPDVRTSVS